jgi:hypothetical protein
MKCLRGKSLVTECIGHCVCVCVCVWERENIMIFVSFGGAALVDTISLPRWLASFNFKTFPYSEWFLGGIVRVKETALLDSQNYVLRKQNNTDRISWAINAIVPSYLQGICFKIPSRCLKIQIASNSLYKCYNTMTVDLMTETGLLMGT